MAGHDRHALRARRQQVFDKHDWKYDLKGQLGDPCVYCGVIADSMDHVPPLHYVARMAELEGAEIEARKVPACRECNSLLGGKLLLTLQTRRAHLKDMLRRKYKAQLKMPSWDAEDLADMAHEMVRSISANLKLREWVMQRLAWKR